MALMMIKKAFPLTARFAKELSVSSSFVLSMRVKLMSSCKEMFAYGSVQLSMASVLISAVVGAAIAAVVLDTVLDTVLDSVLDTVLDSVLVTVDILVTSPLSVVLSFI